MGTEAGAGVDIVSFDQKLVRGREVRLKVPVNYLQLIHVKFCTGVGKNLIGVARRSGWVQGQDELYYILVHWVCGGYSGYA